MTGKVKRFVRKESAWELPLRPRGPTRVAEPWGPGRDSGSPGLLLTQPSPLPHPKATLNYFLISTICFLPRSSQPSKVTAKN